MDIFSIPREGNVWLSIDIHEFWKSTHEYCVLIRTIYLCERPSFSMENWTDPFSCKSSPYLSVIVLSLVFLADISFCLVAGASACILSTIYIPCLFSSLVSGTNVYFWV